MCYGRFTFNRFVIKSFTVHFAARSLYEILHRAKNVLWAFYLNRFVIKSFTVHFAARSLYEILHRAKNVLWAILTKPSVIGAFYIQYPIYLFQPTHNAVKMLGAVYADGKVENGSAVLFAFGVYGINHNAHIGDSL